jgi:haloalkane dehalogenase
MRRLGALCPAMVKQLKGLTGYLALYEPLCGWSKAAYAAPFPDAKYLAGAREFPMLVPSEPDNPPSEANRTAWTSLKAFDKPVLTAFGADDKIMAGIDKVFQTKVPGAAGQDHVILSDAGHFLQEDVGPELAAIVNRFIAG